MNIQILPHFHLESPLVLPTKVQIVRIVKEMKLKEIEKGDKILLQNILNISKILVNSKSLSIVVLKIRETGP